MDQPAMIAAYQQYHQAQTHAQPNSEKQQYQDSFDTSAEIQGIDWGTTASAEDNNKKSKQSAAADPASGLFKIGGISFSLCSIFRAQLFSSLEVLYWAGALMEHCLEGIALC